MRTFALAIATLVLTGACTGDPEPIEPKPSAPGNPTPSEPRMPETANEDTPSGAATFVNYWVSTFNYGAQTGEVDLMLERAGDCKPCSGYAKDFEGLSPSDRPTKSVWRLSNVSVTADRDPIEVEAEVDIAGEKGPSSLVFVLNRQAPFELRDIYKSKP